ncbi:MAG: hypothetical protein ACFFEF_03115 [Candidatus Thorarchaeota archaeon]
MAEIPTPVSAPSGGSRPLGVSILAILMILGGIFSLIGAPASFGPFGYGPIYGVYSLIAGLIGLVLGFSMWQLVPWARKAAIIWYIIGLLMSFVLSLLIGSILGSFGIAVMMIAMIPSIIIDLIIILYLNTSGVKAAFQGVGGW